MEREQNNNINSAVSDSLARAVLAFLALALESLVDVDLEAALLHEDVVHDLLEVVVLHEAKVDVLGVEGLLLAESHLLAGELEDLSDKVVEHTGHVGSGKGRGAHRAFGPPEDSGASGRRERGPGPQGSPDSWSLRLVGFGLLLAGGGLLGSFLLGRHRKL